MLTEFIGWVLNTLTTAAEAEMNDDSALREQLLDAEMRREMGEISDEEFQEIEADLVTRMREIKQRREGGSGPISMGTAPIETTADSRFQVEASVSGDFHEPAEAPHTTVIDTDRDSAQQISVLDMEPGPADRRVHQEAARPDRTTRTTRTTRTNRTPRTDRTIRTTRTIRGTRTRRKP
jgi:hypothetical protein